VRRSGSNNTSTGVHDATHASEQLAAVLALLAEKEAALTAALSERDAAVKSEIRTVQLMQQKGHALVEMEKELASVLLAQIGTEVHNGACDDELAAVTQQAVLQAHVTPPPPSPQPTAPLPAAAFALPFLGQIQNHNTSQPPPPPPPIVSFEVPTAPSSTPEPEPEPEPELEQDPEGFSDDARKDGGGPTGLSFNQRIKDMAADEASEQADASWLEQNGWVLGLFLKQDLMLEGDLVQLARVCQVLTMHSFAQPSTLLHNAEGIGPRTTGLTSM
jgi:hypothetical protein